MRCARCLYDETIPGLTFDDRGVCAYCHTHDQMENEYPTGEEGKRRLEALADEIRKAGRGKPYDVLVGVSGGCDSSYMLHLAKELGLRPLAVHFDNTWNSEVATQNIANVLKALDVDLFTYVVDNKEYDDIYRAFLEAGVPDTDAPTDIALAATLNIAAEKNGVYYLFEGHSFRTEGISPLGWIYMDGRYIRSVHERHGKLPMKTYPNMLLPSFLRWTVVRGIKKIRPLYYTDYVKKDAMTLLESQYGWRWYGGHHLENRFTAFWHSYYLPRRYQIDSRLLGYSALVRSGQMSREDALEHLKTPPEHDPDLVAIVRKRLGYSEAELEALMNLPKKTYRDYPSYKKLFERTRWLWWMLYRLNRVPKSFYVKYATKGGIEVPAWARDASRASELSRAGSA